MGCMVMVKGQLGEAAVAVMQLMIAARRKCPATALKSRSL